MKNLSFTLLALLLLVLTVSVHAQNKLVRVKIYPPEDRTQRSMLIGNLEIDHFAEVDGAIISEIEERVFQRLLTMPVKYEVLEADVTAALERENKRYFDAVRAGADPNTASRVAFSQTGSTIDDIIITPSAFEIKPTFGGYYSFAQMETAMDNLVAAYPGLASKTSIGTTHDGNDIWVIKISDNVATDDPDEPEVLFLGLQHAREAITGASMIFFMQYLCEAYSSDSRINDLVNNREIFIIPCLNPDGWEFNRLNGGAGSSWRKNRRNNPGSGSSEGVDLNRNWGIDWANCSAPILGSAASCGSSSYSAGTYYGPSAFSEPETQAVRDFVYSHQIAAAIDQHAYGPYYSLPFGRPSLHPGADSLDLMDQQFYTRIPALMGMYNGMRAGNSYQAVGYEVAGGVKDWFLKGDIGVGTKGKIYGLTGEGGAGGGSGGTYGNFWAPASQIVNLCKGMVFQNLQMTYAAGSYVDVQDVSDDAVTTLTGSFNFEVRRIGLADSAVTVTLIPIENVQSVGSPVTINSLPDYYDTYTGGISYNLYPALTNGQRIRYALQVQTAGYTYADTITKFYNPDILLNEDMEGSMTAWTASGGWAFSTDDAFQGSRSLTESPGGNYTNNSTRTVTYNSGIDLSDATAAYLSFWTKHRSENFQDKLQVQVSTNGGSSWTSIAGNLTIQEPGTMDGSTLNGQPSLTGWRDQWTKAFFDLSAYNVANLRLRFQFTSSSSSSFFYNLDDGFYIDNLQLTKSTAALVNLPVQFLYVQGRLLADKTILVEWDAQLDHLHDYFEVERSADGSNFAAITKVTGQPPYSIIDRHPLTGNNYYRIKQYDKDGQVSYSKVINVINIPSSKLIIYPNPLPEGENLRIRMEDNRNENLGITITDVQGRLVYQQTVNEWPASGEIKINTDKWLPQVYVIKVTDRQGRFITVQKFIKQ